jgi:hypothetical protein
MEQPTQQNTRKSNSLEVGTRWRHHTAGVYEVRTVDCDGDVCIDPVGEPDWRNSMAVHCDYLLSNFRPVAI